MSQTSTMTGLHSTLSRLVQRKCGPTSGLLGSMVSVIDRQRGVARQKPPRKTIAGDFHAEQGSNRVTLEMCGAPRKAGIEFIANMGRTPVSFAVNNALR